jgi:alpha-glucosidase (family GH31 glycosyl hydrolase)
MTTRQYMDHYYTDEYEHGLTQNPEFVCLSRAVDDGVPYMHPKGFAPLHASAVNWVGDQDHTWEVAEEGIQEALRDVLKSARLGYNVVGSDVGGYSGSEFLPKVYIRWAQWSAYCGLFLNGGHGERRLWLRDADDLELIRRAAWLHTELIPYIYSYVVVGHEGGPVLMRPHDTDYQYYFGDDLFISPIFREENTHTVTLPEGRWRWWYDDTEVIEGPATITREFTISEFPAYIRDGAILPMQISRPYTGIGDRDWETYLTLNLYPHGESSMKIHHPDKSGTTEVKVVAGDPLRITLEGVKKPHILRMLLPQAPASVHLDGKALPAEAWQYDAEEQRLIVRTDTYTQGEYEIRL